MITIDEYIQFTEEMKENGSLSPDFTIKQYSNGCLLGVNGKTNQFDDTACYIGDYTFWDEQGYAYKLVENWSSNVEIGEHEAKITKVTKKVPYPEMNLPSCIKYPNKFTEILFDGLIDECRNESRLYLALISGRDEAGSINFWIGGKRSNIISAFVSIMCKDKEFAKLICDTVEVHHKATTTDKTAGS